MAGLQPEEIQGNQTFQLKEASLLMYTFTAEEEEAAPKPSAPESPVEHLDMHDFFISKKKPLGKWTPAEDAALIRLAQGPSPRTGRWAWIAQQMNQQFPLRDHRRDACLQRFERCLNPKLQKGSWTPKELAVFYKYMQDSSCRYSASQIAAQIGTRCDVQVAKKIKQYQNARRKQEPSGQ